MKCGDVLLVNFPFTDASGSKLRPVLVVSIDAFNQGEDLVLVPISSVPDPGNPHVFSVQKTDPFFAGTGLRASSCVKWTKPFTISRRVVSRRLGALPSQQLSDVQAKLRSLFGG